MTEALDFKQLTRGFSDGERHVMDFGVHRVWGRSPFEGVTLVSGYAIGKEAARIRAAGQDTITLLFALRGDVLMIDDRGHHWRTPADHVGILFRPSNTTFELVVDAQHGREILSVHFALGILDQQPFKTALASIHQGILVPADRDRNMIGTFRMSGEVRPLALEVAASCRIDDVSILEASIRVFRLLDSLSREANHEATTIQWQAPSGGVLDQIFRARQFIESRFNEPLTLKEIARSVGMSEGKLKTAFRTTYGTPPIAFLNAIRVERAQAMLRNNDLTISQIAHAVGYTHPTNFTVAFRRATGVAPRALRNSIVSDRNSAGPSSD